MELNHSLGDTYHLPKAPQDLFLTPWYGQIILTVFMAQKLTNLLVLGTGLEPVFTDLKGRLPKTNQQTPAYFVVRVGFEPTIAQLKRQRVYEVALLTNHARNVESQTYLHINYSFNKMYGQIYLYNLNQLRLKLCCLTIYFKIKYHFFISGVRIDVLQSIFYFTLLFRLGGLIIFQ